MSYNPGDVLVFRFPFTDQQGAKQRPSVVVSSADYNAQRPDVILLALTSQVKTAPGLGGAQVGDWRNAGLLKPSVFKPIIFTAEQTPIPRTLGRLSERDRETLRGLLRMSIDS